MITYKMHTLYINVFEHILVPARLLRHEELNKYINLKIVHFVV